MTEVYGRVNCNGHLAPRGRGDVQNYRTHNRLNAQQSSQAALKAKLVSGVTEHAAERKE